MARNWKQTGEVLEISGSTVNISAGHLYRRTGNGTFGRAWIGVVRDDVIGTAATQTTLDGRPIMIGDGIAAEAQTGTGKGDIHLEGVYTFALVLSGAYVVDGDPIYGSFNANNVASGVTDNVTPANVNFGAISGAFIGFAVGGNYTATQLPFIAGMNVVDVKLFGFPQIGTAAPSE